MNGHRLQKSPHDQNISDGNADIRHDRNARNARILARHEFFHGLPSPTVQRFASRVRQAHYPAGRRIFSKGDPGHGLLAVLSGVVKISVVSEDGKELALNLIGAGEIFGEIALLDGGPRTADATAPITANFSSWTDATCSLFSRKSLRSR